MKTLKLIFSLALIAICLFQPAVAHRLSAQTVSWTSSHPNIVSVDENTGVIQMISEPTETTDVTITAAQTQNGKTATSTKTVQVDACTACFTFQAPSDTQEREYCGVKLSNGQCWMDRNLGASRVATAHNDAQSYGLTWYNSSGFVNDKCPAGYSTPTPDQWMSVAKLITGNNSLLPTDRGTNISPAMAFNFPLKLPATGWNGGTRAGTVGFFWLNQAGTFSDYGDEAKLVRQEIGNGYHMPVRCIRN